MKGIQGGDPDCFFLNAFQPTSTVSRLAPIYRHARAANTSYKLVKSMENLLNIVYNLQNVANKHGYF